MRAWFDKALAILRDNALPGLVAFGAIVLFIASRLSGFWTWLQGQLPIWQAALATSIELQLWFVILLVLAALGGVLILGWNLYRRRQASAADESNVPTDYELAYGVLWLWPFAWERLDQWTPRCPFHGVTVDIFMDKYDPNDGSGTHRMYHFQCRGPENGDPHTIKGPEYDESYTGSMKADVYDRLKGEVLS